MRRSPGRPLWILNHYAVPSDQPSGTRHYDLAVRLVRRGRPVTIFAAGFSHLRHREERIRGWRLYQVVEVNGVRFVFLRTIPYQRNDLWRILNMLSYTAVVLVVQARFARPEVVVGSSVHPFAVLAGYVISRLRGSRFYFEIRDLWPQTLVDVGAMSDRSLVVRMLRKLERFLASRADGVITVLPGMNRYVEEVRLPVRRLHYIPNGVSLASEERARLPDHLARKLEEWTGHFVIGYVGLFGTHNHLETVLEAARILRERSADDIRIVLIGDGAESARLRAVHRESSLHNVEILEPIPKAAVHASLMAFDATLLHVTASPIYRFGMSFNKLFDYMGAGRPILFACRTEFDPVVESACGFTVEPDDPGALADAMVRLARTSADERLAMGRRARRYVEQHHSIDQLAERFETAISGAD